MTRKKQTNLPKKHHYVPRFLLEEFSNNKTHLWGYDKVKGGKFGVNILDAAAENDFNSMPNDMGLEGEQKVVAELIMADIDGKCATILRQLLGNLRAAKLLSPAGFPKFQLNYDHLDALSWFAVIQTIRTKEFRESLVQFGLLTHKAMADFFKETEEGEKLWKEKPQDLDHLNIQMTEGSDKLQHFQLMFDDEFIGRLQDACLKKIWVIGVNTTGTPLCIGDNPVVMNSHTGRAAAWGARGVEIAMPISSDFILIWMCPSLFPRNDLGVSFADSVDCRTVELKQDHVTYYNSLAYLRSMQFIYQGTNDFSLFDEMARNTHPENRNPFRIRAGMNAFGEELKLPPDYRTKGIPIS